MEAARRVVERNRKSHLPLRHVSAPVLPAPKDEQGGLRAGDVSGSITRADAEHSCVGERRPSQGRVRAGRRRARNINAAAAARRRRAGQTQEGRPTRTEEALRRDDAATRTGGPFRHTRGVPRPRPGVGDGAVPETVEGVLGLGRARALRRGRRRLRSLLNCGVVFVEVPVVANFISDGGGRGGRRRAGSSNRAYNTTARRGGRLRFHHTAAARGRRGRGARSARGRVSVCYRRASTRACACSSPGTRRH